MSSQVKLASVPLSVKNLQLPDWYQIGFDARAVAIVLRVHFHYLAGINRYLQPSLWQYLMREFEFESFESNILNSNFGFGSTLERIGVEGNYLAFSVPIPKYHLEKEVFDQRSLQRTSASLAVFFDLMCHGEFLENRTPSVMPQMVTLVTGVSKNPSTAPINGTYGIDLVNWLAKMPPHSYVTVAQEAMKAVERKLFYQPSIDDDRTWARIMGRNGFLVIQCPGNRTSICPNIDEPIRPGYGYEFSSCNVDSHWQQLMLLAGVGALCDIVRQQMQ